jgi:hypothetical protein
LDRAMSFQPHFSAKRQLSKILSKVIMNVTKIMDQPCLCLAR